MKFFFSHFLCSEYHLCAREHRASDCSRDLFHEIMQFTQCLIKKVIKDDCIIIQWTVRSKLAAFDNASLLDALIRSDGTDNWQLSSFIKLMHSRRERQVVKDETFSVLLLERRYKSLKFQDSSSRDGGQMK